MSIRTKERTGNKLVIYVGLLFCTTLLSPLRTPPPPSPPPPPMSKLPGAKSWRHQSSTLVARFWPPTYITRKAGQCWPCQEDRFCTYEAAFNLSRCSCTVLRTLTRSSYNLGDSYKLCLVRGVQMRESALSSRSVVVYQDTSEVAVGLASGLILQANAAFQQQLHWARRLFRLLRLLPLRTMVRMTTAKTRIRGRVYESPRPSGLPP